MIFDCETEPFGPGRMAPPVIATGTEKGIRLGPIGPGYADAVGFSVSYDVACCYSSAPDAWLDAIDTDRIVDLRIRALLFDYATTGRRAGGYSLDDVGRDAGVAQHACKDSTWRTRFSELRGMPPEQWPAEARVYLLEDVRITTELARAIPEQVDERPQARYDVALRWTSNAGLRVDFDRTKELAAEIDQLTTRTGKVLTDAGLLRGNGTRDIGKVRDRIIAAGGTRTTEGGEIATSAKALSEVSDPVLALYAEYTAALGVRDRELPLLRKHPVVHTRYDLAVTGRSTSSGPNLQNLSKRWGVRECFSPRPGNVYLVVDYPALELRTLAQAVTDIVGPNALASAFANGVDPHLLFAVDQLGAPRGRPKDHPDVAPKRQLAKAANFGFPGGLVGENFASFAKDAYGVVVDDPKGVERAWYTTWPEVRLYKRHMEQLARIRQPVAHLRSGRLRAGCSSTQANNTLFQGLGSDVAKDTLWAIWRECRAGVLLGCYPVAFVHDEYVLEAPKEIAEDAAGALVDVIVDRWPRWCPDVPLSLGDLEVHIGDRWEK